MYAFVHIDKTAGTTLKSILRRSFGSRHCDIRLPLAKKSCDGLDHRAAIDLADLRRVRRVYRNLIGFAGHNVKAHTELGRQCPDIRFFTLLRDPVARFRSHFLNRSEQYRQEDFDRWTTESWIHNWQTKMIAGEPNAEKAIEVLSTRIGFVGLTERFDESLMMLGQWLQVPGFCAEYRRLNQYSQKGNAVDAARKRDATTYLDTDSVRSLMQELNTEDQKVYGYVAATLYPRQIAVHQGDLAAELRDFQLRQQSATALAESVWSRFVRGFIYKPLAHCHVA
jgi:hypothetical protein